MNENKPKNDDICLKNRDYLGISLDKVSWKKDGNKDAEGRSFPGKWTQKHAVFVHYSELQHRWLYLCLAELNEVYITDKTMYLMMFMLSGINFEV